MTIVGTSIFSPFVFLSDAFGADTYFTPAHRHDRDSGGRAETVASNSTHIRQIPQAAIQLPLHHHR